MATGLLNFKHRSPRVLLIPLRLTSVSTLHLPGVSCKQLFSNTKVTISPLHLGSPNSKSKSISNIARTAKSFRLSNRINRRFSKISTCNAGRCLTCHHISCESTVTSSINGNKYGIKIDKDVDWNSSVSEWICCLTSQLTIFQSYMWRHIDVQADWRRNWTYGRAPTP